MRPSFLPCTAAGLLALAAAGPLPAQLFIGSTEPGVNSPADNPAGVSVAGEVNFFYDATSQLGRASILVQNTNTGTRLTGFSVYYNQALFAFDSATLPTISYQIGNALVTDVIRYGVDTSEAFGGNPGFNIDLLSALAEKTTGPGGASHIENSLFGGFEATFNFYFTLKAPATPADFGTDAFFSGNDDDWDLIFRFQAIDNPATAAVEDDSAKLGVNFTTLDNPILPEPSTYGACGAALLVAAVVWRRRRR